MVYCIVVWQAKLSGVLVYSQGARSEQHCAATQGYTEVLTLQMVQFSVVGSNGCDILYVQQFLGHARIDTTVKYIRTSIKSLKEAHAKFHPSEKKEVA